MLTERGKGAEVGGWLKNPFWLTSDLRPLSPFLKQLNKTKNPKYSLTQIRQ